MSKVQQSVTDSKAKLPPAAMENMNSESTERPLEIKAPVFVNDPTNKKVT